MWLCLKKEDFHKIATFVGKLMTINFQTNLIGSQEYNIIYNIYIILYNYIYNIIYIYKYIYNIF